MLFLCQKLVLIQKRATVLIYLCNLVIMAPFVRFVEEVKLICGIPVFLS
jgi:hypothetical protein